jgi:hypothetical protein
MLNVYSESKDNDIHKTPLFTCTAPLRKLYNNSSEGFCNRAYYTMYIFAKEVYYLVHRSSH